MDLSGVGLAVGHATDDRGATGLTVVLPTKPMHGGYAIVGRATGTRELTALDPDHLADRVDAVLLVGGSAFGLDAAAGAMRWLAERGRGFPAGPAVVPIVPAAVIFDLGLGDASARPTPEMAYAACESAASRDVAEGSVGAGTGATVGKALGPSRAMKGGFGIALEEDGGLVVAAVVVVNALGDVRDDAGRIIAGARDEHGGFADGAAVLAAAGGTPPFAAAMRQTTLAVVATSASLTRPQLAMLAGGASAALFRRITPAGTAFDGDIVFALAPRDGAPAPYAAAERLAIAALEGAIERAIRRARGRDGIPGLADAEAAA